MLGARCIKFELACQQGGLAPGEFFLELPITNLDFTL